MKCPIDDSVLSVSAREGVEIDFCPQCRGVWLDRGELDKIIDRAASTLGGAAVAPERDAGYERPRQDDRGFDARGYDDRHRDPRKRKRRSFLDDLFDFD